MPISGIGGQVIEKYGNAIDFMRDYSHNNDIKNEIATALNIYEKRSDIEPSDFGGIKLLHTKEAVLAYEQKHGIKSFLFDVELPKEKFKQLMPKVGGKEWYGGLYFPHIQFKGFHHSHLFFSKLGFGLEQETGGFEHEALHCDKRIYTARYHARFTPSVRDADYPDARWRALAEFNLAEEILSFMADGSQPEMVEQLITEKYIEYIIDFFLGNFTIANEGQKAEKRKQFEQILMPVKNSAGYAVKFAYLLKEKLPFNILTPPLFFNRAHS